MNYCSKLCDLTPSLSPYSHKGSRLAGQKQAQLRHLWSTVPPAVLVVQQAVTISCYSLMTVKMSKTGSLQQWLKNYGKLTGEQTHQ